MIAGENVKEVNMALTAKSKFLSTIGLIPNKSIIVMTTS